MQISAMWNILCLTEFIEPEHTAWDWLASEIIRFCTFWRLKLKHTCCQSPDKPSIEDESEIREIQDEQQEILEKFEDLIIEFEDKRRELGGSLARFMREYWYSHKVWFESVPVDEAKIREIGVVLDRS